MEALTWETPTSAKDKRDSLSVLHLASQYWGFGGLFLIGFLWAAMGGAGTAFPAVADRETLTKIFRPILWVFGTWVVYKILIYQFAAWESSDDATWKRHAAVLYV